jgi:hypothetical protein
MVELRLIDFVPASRNAQGFANDYLLSWLLILSCAGTFRMLWYGFLSSHGWDVLLTLNHCLGLQERLQEEATGKTTRREEVSLSRLITSTFTFRPVSLFSLSCSTFDHASYLESLLLKRAQNVTVLERWSFEGHRLFLIVLGCFGPFATETNVSSELLENFVAGSLQLSSTSC